MQDDNSFFQDILKKKFIELILWGCFFGAGGLYLINNKFITLQNEDKIKWDTRYKKLNDSLISISTLIYPYNGFNDKSFRVNCFVLDTINVDIKRAELVKFKKTFLNTFEAFDESDDGILCGTQVNSGKYSIGMIDPKFSNQYIYNMKLDLKKRVNNYNFPTNSSEAAYGIVEARGDNNRQIILDQRNKNLSILDKIYLNINDFLLYISILLTIIILIYYLKKYLLIKSKI